jgi:hypothetical protein
LLCYGITDGTYSPQVMSGLTLLAKNFIDHSQVSHDDLMLDIDAVTKE